MTLQIGMRRVGFAQRLVSRSPGSMSDCLVSLGPGVAPVSVVELSKRLQGHL